jgi:site-specific DNA-methyltransferase (adenine-specific)
MRPANRTLRLTDHERIRYQARLLQINHPVTLDEVVNRTLQQDCFLALPHLPTGVVDLVVADPPYNLNKSFNGTPFSRRETDDYMVWLDQWISHLVPLLKPTASIYICGDWRSSGAIERVVSHYFHIQNRITWEREKGRGAKTNWKNASEDIWFCTVSPSYTFNVEAVKLKRRVLAPYRDGNGTPKDWSETADGDFRLTYPSNLWTDLTVPFWSMPENTNHPTQKPEKLIAKIILASSHENDLVLDPFLGSGTTSVVAKKLNRRFIGIEQEAEYCLLAEKRLELAEHHRTIQGYTGGFFWERNTLKEQKQQQSDETYPLQQERLI